jgi:hypothetical protein
MPGTRAPARGVGGDRDGVGADAHRLHVAAAAQHVGQVDGAVDAQVVGVLAGAERAVGVDR